MWKKKFVEVIRRPQDKAHCWRCIKLVLHLFLNLIQAASSSDRNFKLAIQCFWSFLLTTKLTWLCTIQLRFESAKNELPRCLSTYEHVPYWAKLPAAMDCFKWLDLGPVLPWWVNFWNLDSSDLQVPTTTDFADVNTWKTLESWESLYQKKLYVPHEVQVWNSTRICLASHT